MSSRAKLLQFAALSAFLLGPIAARAASAKAPDSISYPNAGYATWVSAQLAEQRGLADTTVFHPQARADIAAILGQTPVAGCYEAGPMIVELSGGRNRPLSLEDAARSYPIFAYGKVRELTPGFVIGEAGHLATVEVTEASRGIEAGRIFYVFLPLGKFVFQGKNICKVDPRYAGLPAVGDELLVFADRPALAAKGLWTIDHPEAVVLVSGGQVRWAPALEKARASRPESKMPNDRKGLLALLPRL